MTGYTATVSQKQKLSEKVFLVTLTIQNSESITFLPGQFVNITVGDNVKRQYSIASSPSHADTIDLVVDITPGGPGSHYFEALKLGDIVSLSAPMGRFVLVQETGRITFLAAGTGIAPLKSMIDYLLEKQKRQNDSHMRSICFYVSFRFEQDIFLRDYFENYQKEHENFHFSLTLSRPGEHWNGHRGYIQTCIDKELLSDPDSHFYICGGTKMVQGTLQFLREKQISEKQIHFEPF
jgi:NAD(P)H-flavin reductase